MMPQRLSSSDDCLSSCTSKRYLMDISHTKSMKQDSIFAYSVARAFPP